MVPLTVPVVLVAARILLSVTAVAIHCGYRYLIPGPSDNKIPLAHSGWM